MVALVLWMPLLAGIASGRAADSPALSNLPPVATFSVVGFDPATGDLGVAVESKFFGVGSVVPWARTERTSSSESQGRSATITPAFKVKEFHFTSQSEAV